MPFILRYIHTNVMFPRPSCQLAGGFSTDFHTALPLINQDQDTYYIENMTPEEKINKCKSASVKGNYIHRYEDSTAHHQPLLETQVQGWVRSGATLQCTCMRDKLYCRKHYQYQLTVFCSPGIFNVSEQNCYYLKSFLC